MTNEIALVMTKELGLTQANNLGELPKPFAKDILLTTFELQDPVFGTTAKEMDLPHGCRLQLFRDRKNRYDKNSIVLKNAAGDRVGFVPISKNEILARLLEAGKVLYATVTQAQKAVKIKIYLEA